MINLMYVVLMAMLALNTPTEEELGVKGKSLVEKVKRSLQDEPRKGDEKKNLQVSDLLAKFQIASGGEFANDRMILS